MPSPESELPPADDLRVDLLAGLFRNVATSYKFLFFLALLDRLPKTEDALRLSLRELVVEMLLLAWYPRFFFRLRFGAEDRIGAALEGLPHELREGWGSRPEQRAALRRRLTEQLPEKVITELSRYVRVRLIRPFLDDQLPRGRDASTNARLVLLATERFDSARPLYRIEVDERQIVLHPAWWRYLQRHAGILRGWALWHWTVYMQARNPDVPAISTKLEPPLERGGLAAAKKFWTATAATLPLVCPYSTDELGDFELDHFVPWSFVAHDRAWNLVPATRIANSSKSDRLPDVRYVPAVARLHARALWMARERLHLREWRKLVEPYVLDLHAAPTLLEHDVDRRDDLEAGLLKAYESSLPPLLAVAANHGFSPGWNYAAG